MSNEFDRETFADVINSTFTLCAPDGKTVDITLKQVSQTRETARQRSFSILFSVPNTHRVEQGLYDLRHDTLGDLNLFLVPVGLPNEGHELESVFNYLKK